VKLLFRLMLLAGIACEIHWYLLFGSSARCERDIRFRVQGWGMTNESGWYITEQQASHYPEIARHYYPLLREAEEMQEYFRSGQRWAFIAALLLIVTSSVGLSTVRKDKQVSNNSVQPTAGRSPSGG
jgi:hypothetical protein